MHLVFHIFSLHPSMLINILVYSAYFKISIHTLYCFSDENQFKFSARSEWIYSYLIRDAYESVSLRFSLYVCVYVCVRLMFFSFIHVPYFPHRFLYRPRVM